MSLIDPHSYYDTDQPAAKSAHLDWSVDFERHVIDGTVRLELASAASGPLDLDTKGLTIHSATTTAAPRSPCRSATKTRSSGVGSAG